MLKTSSQCAVRNGNPIILNAQAYTGARKPLIRNLEAAL